MKTKRVNQRKRSGPGDNDHCEHEDDPLSVGASALELRNHLRPEENRESKLANVAPRSALDSREQEQGRASRPGWNRGSVEPDHPRDAAPA